MSRDLLNRTLALSPLPSLRPTQDSLAGEPAYGGPAVPPSSVSGGPSGALRRTQDSPSGEGGRSLSSRHLGPQSGCSEGGVRGGVRRVRVGSVVLANNLPLTAIGGCCAIESAELTKRVARGLRDLFRRLGVGFIFKASFDKANRSSGSSWRGIGVEAGLRLLKDIRKDFGVPVLTDIHEPSQAAVAAKSADALQIPAFLCRQTDLIEAAADTGRAVNIKKGQFLSPWEMRNALGKATARNNNRLLVTERGFMFGYNNLVVDMRSLEVLKGLGYPVVYDATHSQQLPGVRGKSTGGMAEFVVPVARAAAAVGIAGIFFETHPNPIKAKSDGLNSIAFNQVENMWRQLMAIDKAVKMDTATR